MKKNIQRRSGSLTVVSVTAGGVAGWVVNTTLSIISDTDMTHLYGISIFQELLSVYCGI
ncbi:hypothetical protein [Niallia sp. FSL M8-0099]|uniref:hypothetical protein n=1 Tax=Niallia sp. FSL M8-0099 TaxID=2954519 RepID=UPI0030F885A4